MLTIQYETSKQNSEEKHTHTHTRFPLRWKGDLH